MVFLTGSGSFELDSLDVVTVQLGMGLAISFGSGLSIFSSTELWTGLVLLSVAEPAS